MRLFLCLLCCFLLLSQTSAISAAASHQNAATQQQQVTPQTGGQPVLEDGTPVRLRLSQTVSSADAHVNDRVEFEVLEEVRVAGVLVIAKSATALGTVTEAQSKRRMARGGKLEIVMDSVRLTNGQRASLRAVKDAKGGGHTGGMTIGIVATGLLFWPAAPLFLLIHGKDISIPKGTEVPTFVNGNLPIELARFQQPVPGASQPIQSNALATVNVTSTPGGADISVDHNFVGNTPSSVGLPFGKHVISVKKQGFKDWEREITVSSGTVNLVADLALGSSGNGSEASEANPPASQNPPPAPVAAPQEKTQPQEMDQFSRGWIGVSTVTQGTGAYAITKLVPDGPAAIAGLAVGDVITALNGTPLAEKNFDDEIARLKPGSEMRVTYLRRAWQLEAKVTVGKER
jgi:hypothetical protein